MDLIDLPVFVGKTNWPWVGKSEQLPEYMPDGSIWPRLTIVTPSFNQGQFIEEAIRSVLLQGYPNLEYIIIDGGSTDNSIDIIKKYEPWLSYWISEKDRGQVYAINKGFARATGELAGWLNSDDIYFPGAFETVVSKWVSQGKPDSLITGTKLKGDAALDTITRLDQAPFTIQHLLERSILEQPATFFPLDLFRRVGGIDKRYPMSPDYDLWLRMTKQGADILFTETDLAVTRMHPLTKTSQFHYRSLYQALQSVWRNYRRIPRTWVKKLITVIVVPQDIRSERLSRFFYIIRNVLYRITMIILESLDLSKYQERG